MNREMIYYEVIEEEQGMRIDRYISSKDIHLSRSYIQKLIKSKDILVNQESIKSSYQVMPGDCIVISVPEPTELEIVAEKIPLDIIYEDKDIILINKEKGMVVHPAAGHYSGTLVNALLYHCKDELSGINGILRPGIVHRIDMDTTGIIVVCKNDKAHAMIAEQLKEHSITRSYNALVHGIFKEKEWEGIIDAPIKRSPSDRKKMAVVKQDGKRAVTHYKVIENLGNKYAHIECSLETGRTHQIRVHMASIHHPLIGDSVYGSNKDLFRLKGQCLHARILGFHHPTTGKYMEWEAPIPEYFNVLIDKLR